MTFRVSTLFLIICLFCTYAYGRQEFFPFLAEVTSDHVNVRAGQSANFERLCQLDKGDHVIILDKNFSWYKVRLPKIAKSYIIEKYVLLRGKDRGEVIADNVNIRAGAGIKFSVIGQLDSGDKVTILEYGQKWYKIEPVEGSFGWILDKYLAFKSKDIKAYHPKILITKEQQLAKQREEEQRKKAEEIKRQKELEAKSKVSLKGLLKTAKGNESKGIYYKLVTHEQTVYFIQGFKGMLDDFLNFIVQLEGKKVTGEGQPNPVVNVLKVQLVL